MQPDAHVEERDAGEAAAPDESALAAGLDALRDGLFLCDVLGRVTYANAGLRRLLGGSGDEGAPLGRHWAPLFVEESRRRIEREALPAILSDGNWRGPVELRGPEGRPLPATLSLSAGHRGCLVGLLCAEPPGPLAEAERIGRAEARGERLDALRRLAGEMAHDLNNLLTSMVGYARFLTEDLAKDSQQHGFAEQIVTATQRAKQLLDGTLAFARPGSGGREAVPLGPAVEQAGAAARRALPAGATLRIKGSDAGLAVEAEPEAFADALGQLLANAAEALEGRPGTVELDWRAPGDLRGIEALGPPGEASRIAIRRVEGEAPGEARLLASVGAPDPSRRYLELIVSDSGAGIAPEVMEHVFEPFFTTRQPAKGRGLGLATLFGSVVGHGGALLLDSAVGRGTTVRLFWPAAPADGQRASLPTPAPATAPATGAATGAAADGGVGGPPGTPARRRLPRGLGQRILVAEDDRVLREAIGEMLQRLGYRPALVNDGEAARRLLAEGGEIEAVLTDRRMPNLSGTDLIDWMRAQGLRQPVLLCTGYGEDLDGRSLARAGGVFLLSKPIDAATLANSLDQLLGASRG